MVLSGFIITTVLLEEWGGNCDIDLGEFWIRRARCLLPALALVLTAVALYGAIAAPRATRGGLEQGSRGGHVLRQLAFYSRPPVVLRRLRDPAAPAAPWSLAVEEHWDIVWPPALLLMVRRLRRRCSPSRTPELLLAVLGVLTVASFTQVLRLDLITHRTADSGRSYYGTDTHIRVLLTGATLAVARVRWSPNPAGRYRGVRLAGTLYLSCWYAPKVTQYWATAPLRRPVRHPPGNGWHPRSKP